MQRVKYKYCYGIRRGKVFKDQSPRIQDPSGYQGTKVPVSALPDRRRRPVVTPAVSPEAVQLQLAVVAPPVEARNARPVPVVLELVAAEVRCRSTIEPREAPVRELNQRREHLAGSNVGLTPEGVGTLTLATFGVEGQPDGFRVLDLVGGETQIPLVGLDALPAVLGVALRSVDQVPQGVERVRHVEKQHLGLRPGRELLGRLGQFAPKPDLTCTRELLLGGAPPGRPVVPGGSNELALDDVLKRPLDGNGVERAVADALDDLVVLGGDTAQLLDGGHDNPLSFAVDFSDATCSGDLNYRLRTAYRMQSLYAKRRSQESAKLLRFSTYNYSIHKHFLQVFIPCRPM